MISKTASSIQVQVALVISLIFIVILGVSTAVTVFDERAQATQFGMDKARDIGESYFKGLNTLMLTGTMEQKNAMRDKLLADKQLLELGIVRVPGIFPSSVQNESATKDEQEIRALAGETISTVTREGDGRKVTVLSPIKASTDYLGTNCLGCHQVAEGRVLGLIRTTYSLNELDRRTNHALLVNIGINAALFVAGLALVILILRHIVIRPISEMRSTMHEIEVNADLGRRLAVKGKSEIGALASSVNSMLDNFQNSLCKVSDTSRQLSSVAEQIANVSETTSSAANEQLQESDLTSRFIDDLKVIAHETENSAAKTANASVEAEQQAIQGTALTREAIAGIHELVEEIGRTAALMERLDARSKNVSNVLDVIREIADQTNLLALNAAIEAARAGEAGRGFAVVADEVRRLATRSQESTGNIEEIVGQLQSEAKQAVESMQHSRGSAEQRNRQLQSAIASLDQITARVTDIRELNGEMAKAIQHEGELTESGGEKIATIGKIAERTASDAMQTSLISDEVVTLARELKDLVARFKLNTA